MTLILNCLTHKYAIQVSDRRLTKPNGDIDDDNSTKAILYCGHMIFGYTGLAKMDKNLMKTDEWFLNTLNQAYEANKNANLTETAEFVAKMASKAIDHVKTSLNTKRLAFVGVGWSRLVGTNELHPIYIMISNAHDNDGNWLPEAKPQFSVSVIQLPDEKEVGLIADGQQIDRQTRLRVLRMLRSCTRKDVGPKSLARILVSTARTVASSNSLVGKNLLVSCIPKVCVYPGKMLIVGSPPIPNRTTFSYIPENKYAQIAYGPHSFCGGVTMKDFFVKQGI